MNNAYLLLGGNLDDRKSNLAMARKEISNHCGEIVRQSSIYETEAWGMRDQPAFLNQAIVLATSLNARQLMRRLLKIEKSMGRVRKEKLGPRLIDIDILFFNQEVQNISFLQIPHPELQNRRFALLPMNEIAASLVHPVFNKTVADLLKECPDESEVKLYSGI